MTNPTSLQRLLRPQTIAIVGGDLAAEVIRQCDKIGYTGEIWPVHPHRSEVEGRSCFRTVADLPGSPDAAFVGVSREITIEVVQALAQLQAGGVVCYASGFAEIGGEGLELQAKLRAAMGDMALVGPNCYGILNYLDRVTLWPDEHGGQRLERGAAIIAQSGNIGISLSMQQRSVPVAYLISTGNQAGVTIHEYVEALLEDERVTAIGIHLEGLQDVTAFSKAALKALVKGIPIVVIKSGASALGSQMAMSHTSSLAGADNLYDALFARVGILRVHTLPEFMEALKFLAVIGPLPDNKIASISCSGGEAALVADRATALGLPFPSLTEPQAHDLHAVLGERVALANPLDYHTYIWEDEEAQYSCFSAMLQGTQDITLKILDYPRADLCDDEPWVKTARAFTRAVTARTAQGHRTRGVLVSTLHENLPLKAREAALAAGVVPMLGLEECLIAIRGAAQIYRTQQRHQDIVPLASPAQIANAEEITTLDEAESKRRLAAYGFTIPHAVSGTAVEISQASQTFSYPAVLKILSAEIVHKSDVGGVQVNLQSPEDVGQALIVMQDLGDQFLLEAMAVNPVAELILGLTRDPQFGLALIIGAGGVLVELFKDSVTLLLPVNRQMVLAALDSLKIAPLLNGYRGQPPADKEAIVEAVLSLARFAEAHAGEIVEVDINPLFALPEGVVAVDGVVRTRK